MFAHTPDLLVLEVLGLFSFSEVTDYAVTNCREGIVTRFLLITRDRLAVTRLRTVASLSHHLPAILLCLLLYYPK